MIVAFFFTTILFGFFLYYFVWRNRFVTQIRLAVSQTGGRVISIKRQIKIAKKIRTRNHPEDTSDVLTIQNVEWKIVYRDHDEVLRESRCRPVKGQLYWDPPLF